MSKTNVCVGAYISAMYFTTLLGVIFIIFMAFTVWG